MPLVFYRAASGAEPVLDWLKSLPKEERREIGQDLMRAQWRWPVGMPLCRRSLGGGLWEVHDKAHRTRLVLHPGRPHRCPAWFYQEDPEDAGGGIGTGEKRMKEVTRS